ncbi:MAG: hypothetical protein COU10_00565 [Candidatus Harrisonbacteria bacterium CG10_big_fil_rev_8_21_14_0_10_45_28]|uniref:Phosphatidylglycerol lysyltransferase C-terminal domain-containing protein n=1 Tax=Candidatus Harrisonbacteria bacterium CG10_big_fil_rev_8_21_14_0_10_45_28 TaxID=1974586 RepID=A0A2H0UP63_9BACT|nr:MAG: hypothetical protein COU10_00565 [Candidatus Harrisonbacteria bacterium CG10_big_fil_rev_8_21_14_0_10_45_28]
MDPKPIKYDHSKHAALSAVLPFSYFSSPVYLDFFGFIREENGEQAICWHDPETNTYPRIFPPEDKTKLQNIIISRATQGDIDTIEKEKIPILEKTLAHHEYYYQTKTLLSNRGKMGQRIRQFKKENPNHKILSAYDPKKILSFYQKWKLAKPREDQSINFFAYHLNNLKKYITKEIYVEIKGELAGFAWGAKHPQNGCWVGLQLKAIYDFNGLSRLLHQERAKLFANEPFLTLGPESDNLGIKQFKEELGPSEIKEYFYIQTGTKSLPKITKTDTIFS